MSTQTFELRVTDFERAPWRPVSELVALRDVVANLCASALDRAESSWSLDYARSLAHEVALMRAEDLRVGSAYREAYAAWKASAA